MRGRALPARESFRCATAPKELVHDSAKVGADTSLAAAWESGTVFHLMAALKRSVENTLGKSGAGHVEARVQAQNRKAGGLVALAMIRV